MTILLIYKLLTSYLTLIYLMFVAEFTKQHLGGECLERSAAPTGHCGRGRDEEAC